MTSLAINNGAYDNMVYGLNVIKADLNKVLQENNNAIKNIRIKNLLAKLDMQIEVFERTKDKQCIIQRLNQYA